MLVTFSPLSTASETLSISFSWFACDVGPPHFNAELIDVGEASSIWTADWYPSLATPYGAREESITYDFDAAHVYTLHFSLETYAGDVGRAAAQAGTSSLQRIPEPATLLFLGIGLIAIPAIRRRFR
jgi:hypothetical protein